MAHYTLLFSPTGGTAHLAQILCPESDIIDILKPCEGRAFTAEDTVLAAVPSFCGRVPALAAEHLRLFTGNGARGILLCAYGNREYDDTLSELQDIMTERGFTVVAAVAAVTRHSVYPAVAADRPDDADMEDLEYFASAIKKAKIPLPPLPGSHGTYRSFTLEPYDPAGTEECTECGVCVKECPVGALNPENPRFIPNAKCIACMRCVWVCPEKARKIAPTAMGFIAAFLSPYVNERKPNELFVIYPNQPKTSI